MKINLNDITAEQAVEMIEKAIRDAGIDGKVSVKVEDSKPIPCISESVTYTFTFERAK